MIGETWVGGASEAEEVRGKHAAVAAVRVADAQILARPEDDVTPAALEAAPRDGNASCTTAHSLVKQPL